MLKESFRAENKSWRKTFLLRTGTDQIKISFLSFPIRSVPVRWKSALTQVPGKLLLSWENTKTNVLTTSKLPKVFAWEKGVVTFTDLLSEKEESCVLCLSYFIYFLYLLLLQIHMYYLRILPEAGHVLKMFLIFCQISASTLLIN